MNDNTEENVSISDIARDEKVSELEILQQSLEDKKKLAADYYDQLLRLRAEFDNFRKRTEKEKANYISWGKEDIIQKLLNIIDFLGHAQAGSLNSNNIDSVKKGIGLIHQEFLKLLSNEGVKEIDDSKKLFDPALHEAIEYHESEQPESTILATLQKGYMLNEKVLRPAKVKVSKNKDKK